MSVLRTNAIVLRRTDYGEADRILELLTPEGNVSVLAKGVRREKSRLAGGIELFAVSDVVIQKGRGDLGVLTAARLVDFYRNILGDYDRLQFGYEALKHISRQKDVPEEEWFYVLKSILEGLDDTGVELQLVKMWFFLRAAASSGHELNVGYDIQGERLREDCRYMYDIAERGFRKTSRGEITADHIKFLRIAAKRPLKIITQIGGIGNILPECFIVARQHCSLE